MFLLSLTMFSCKLSSQSQMAAILFLLHLASGTLFAYYSIEPTEDMKMTELKIRKGHYLLTTKISFIARQVSSNFWELNAVVWNNREYCNHIFCGTFVSLADCRGFVIDYEKSH